jgi:flagellar capping protein FliD
MNAERQDLSEDFTKDISTMEEQVTDSTKAARNKIAGTYKSVSDTMGKVIKRSRGLETGEPESIVEETSKVVGEDYASITEKLNKDLQTKIGLAGRKMEDETTSMTRAIKDMEAEIAGLDTSYLGNVFG